tara:strand:+ start:502 stop:714 length:213 start_codon:yes stop_codon:yes gene_type:complete
MNKMVNGKLVAMTDEEIAEFNARQSASTWFEDRISEYPTIEDQLDEIYHNGIDAWKAKIKAVKDKYPKPS